jgi:DsbC/DsbD-like thiol-disulfide interchange protein
MLASLMVAMLVLPPVIDAAAPSLAAKWQVASFAAPNGSTEMTLTITLDPGWHLNANDPDRPYLIPTTLEIDPPTGTTIEDIRYPEAVVRRLAFATGMPLRLYEGTFAIRVRLAGPAPRRFEASLGYQACNDETCLPPRTLPVPFDAGSSGTFK